MRGGYSLIVALRLFCFPDLIISEKFHSLILNLRRHIILIHARFFKLAYPRLIGYADYAGFIINTTLRSIAGENQAL